MAGKKVTLVIEVDDKDLESAEKSLGNLKKAAKDAGTGKADLDGLTESSEGLSGGLAGVGAKAAIAAGAVAAAAAAIGAAAKAAVQGAREIFNLTKEYADLGREISKITDSSKIGADAVSALRFQARKTDTDFGKVTASIENFVQTVSDASAGSKAAQSNLDSLGIDGKAAAADIDSAFRQAIETIAKMEPGVERANAANKAFGSTGQELLPFIDQFDGDLDSLIKTAREFGFVMGDENIKATEEFNDALKDIELQIEGLKLIVGKDFLPVVSDVMGEIGSLLSNNKDEIRSWSSFFAASLQRTVDGYKLALAAAKDYFFYLRFNSNTNFFEQRLDEIRTRNLETRLGGTRDIGLSSSVLERSRTSSGRGTRGGRAPSIDTLLPERGFGFTTYNRTGNDQFGTRQAISNLQSLAKAWASISAIPVQFGDISRSGGGPFAPHKAHRSGDQVDIRPFRRDGRNLPTNINDPAYDREATRDFVKLIKKMFPSATILFNDPALIAEGLTKFSKGHGNHLHANRIGGSLVDALGGDAGFLQFSSEISDRLTKEARAKQVQKLLEIHKKAGLVPTGALLKEFHDSLVTEARKAGAVQPTIKDAQAEFGKRIAESIGDTGLIDSPDGPLDLNISGRSTLPKALIDLFGNAPDVSDAIFREELEAARSRRPDNEDLATAEATAAWVERLRNYENDYVDAQIESFEFGKRYLALTASRARHEEIVNALVKDRKQSQDEEFDILTKQLEVQNRLFGDERFRQSEKDLLVLREKIGLQQEIFGMENRIATVGANAAERYRLAWLDAIYEVRDANIQAVESQIRSQVRLADMLAIHHDQIRANVLEHLAAQKSMTETIADEIINLYEEIARRSDDIIDKTIGKIPIVGGIAKTLARNTLSKITQGLLDAIIPGLGSEITKTQNPIARPIVDAVGQSNKLLANIDKNIAQATGGAASSNAGVAGLFSSLLGLLSGGAASGLIQTSSGLSPAGIFGAGPGGNSAGGGGLGSIFGSIFGTGPGGIFAPIPTRGGGTSAVGGYLSGIGSLASLAGGLIGGKAGSVLGSVGSGIATGAAIGSFIPGIGTVVGAAIGGIVGFFSSIFGSKKRKEDKAQLPKLQEGFARAIEQFNELIAGVRNLTLNPENALTQGKNLRKEVASGFGLVWQSKKYRAIARDRINQHLAQIDAEPDGLMAQLEKAVEVAKAAGDRRQQILPEFAGGFFIRTNGFLGGKWSGRDYIPALLADAEMVLNPAQQAAVIRNAGGQNVFRGAGIPNYENQSAAVKKMNVGGVVRTGGNDSRNIGAPVHVQLVLEGDTFDEKARLYAYSDDGRRVTTEVVKNLQKQGQL